MRPVCQAFLPDNPDRRQSQPGMADLLGRSEQLPQLYAA